MTVVGKILTFLIFFMSVVFFGLALSINQLNKDPKTHKSWPEVAAKQQDVIKSLSADVDNKDQQTKGLFLTIDKLRSELDTAKKNYENELAQRRRETEDAKAQRDQATREFQKYQDIASSMEDELKRRREESTRLYDDLKKRDLAVADIQANLTKITNDKIQAQQGQEIFRERTNSLIKQNQELTRALQEERQRTTEQLQASGSKEIARRPPPDNVKGVVKSVAKDGLVSLSIGSDAGLLVGHTLEVFRVDPKAEYVGTVQILETSPHESVGKLMSPQSKRLVRVNDQVATKILSP